MAITTAGPFVPSVWSKKLLDEFTRAGFQTPSPLALTLINMSEQFASIHKTGFLENVSYEEDIFSLRMQVRLQFSKGRHLTIECDYPDNHRDLHAMHSLAKEVLKQLPPDVLATECLRISAMPKTDDRMRVRNTFGVKTFANTNTARIKNG